MKMFFLIGLFFPLAVTAGTQSRTQELNSGHFARALLTEYLGIEQAYVPKNVKRIKFTTSDVGKHSRSYDRKGRIIGIQTNHLDEAGFVQTNIIVNYSNSESFIINTIQPERELNRSIACNVKIKTNEKVLFTCDSESFPPRIYVRNISYDFISRKFIWTENPDNENHQINNEKHEKRMVLARKFEQIIDLRGDVIKQSRTLLDKNAIELFGTSGFTTYWLKNDSGVAYKADYSANLSYPSIDLTYAEWLTKHQAYIKSGSTEYFGKMDLDIISITTDKDKSHVKFLTSRSGKLLSAVYTYH